MKDKYTELSERQREVCYWFVWFMGVKDWKESAAEMMNISVNTLKTHLSETYTKLCVGTQAELMYELFTHKELLTEGF